MRTTVSVGRVFERFASILKNSHRQFPYKIVATRNCGRHSQDGKSQTSIANTFFGGFEFVRMCGALVDRRAFMFVAAKDREMIERWNAVVESVEPRQFDVGIWRQRIPGGYAAKLLTPAFVLNSVRLRFGSAPGHAGGMPERSFPADHLARHTQRIAAGRPDPIRILAKTITMTGVIGMDPCAALGTLVEGAVQTIVQQVPQERQAETAATLVRLLKERLVVCGITNDEDGGGQQSSAGD
jgi:hypothetical protein